MSLRGRERRRRIHTRATSDSSRDVSYFAKLQHDKLSDPLKMVNYHHKDVDSKESLMPP